MHVISSDADYATHMRSALAQWLEGQFDLELSHAD